MMQDISLIILTQLNIGDRQLFSNFWILEVQDKKFQLIKLPVEVSLHAAVYDAV